MSMPGSPMASLCSLIYLPLNSVLRELRRRYNGFCRRRQSSRRGVGVGVEECRLGGGGSVDLERDYRMEIVLHLYQSSDGE